MKSIAVGQREELEFLARKDLMSQGKMPTADDIQSWIVREYGEIAFGSPTVQLYHQGRGRRLDAQRFLHFLRMSFFDVQVLHRLQRSDSVDLIDDTIAENERYLTLMSNVDELGARAQRIKEVLGKENSSSEKIRIDLLNASHISRANTTAVIDPGSRSILLPMLPGKTARILTDAMRLARSPKIVITNVTAKKVLRNVPVNGQDFTNCLMDSNRPWMQEIALQQYTGELRVEIFLEITVDPQNSPLVNRIELEPSIGNTGDIGVFYSDGNQQFYQFGDTVRADAQKSILVDAPARLHRIRIDLTMSGPSYSSGPEHVYVFGLDALRLINASYNKRAEFVTPPLPLSEVSYIRASAVSAVDSVPAGTNLEYYVQFHNDYETSDWVRISPLEREAPQYPDHVNTQAFFSFFGSTIPVDHDGVPQNLWLSTDTEVIGGNQTVNTRKYPYLYKYRNGLEFYAVGGVPTDRTVDVNTSRLYRGIGQWNYRNEQFEVNGDVDQEYLNFKLDNNQQRLYVYVTEKVTVISGLGTAEGVPSSDLILLQTVHHIDKPDSMIPPAGQVGEADARYAVEYVKRTTFSTQNRFSGGAIANTADRPYLIPESEEQLINIHSLDQGPVNIFVRYADGGDDFLEVVGLSNFTTSTGANIQVANIQRVGGGLWIEDKTLDYWQITFENITSLVRDVKGQLHSEFNDPRVIQLEPGTLIMPGDEVEVKYRALVGPESGVFLKPNTLSIVSDEGRTLEKGVDYFVNTVTGVLTALSSVGASYASFNYLRKTTALHVVSSWFYAATAFSTQLDQLGVDPDYASGEGVFLDTGQGIKRLDSGATIEFQPGWHQLIVAGKTVDRMVSLRVLRDNTGAIVFATGRYFSKQNAVQIPLNHVDISTLYWRSMRGRPAGFSIEDNLIVVPFNPFENALTSDYYGIYKGEADSGLTDIALIAESFEIAYAYIRSELLTPDSGIVPEQLAGQGEAVPLAGRHVYDKVSIKAVLSATGEKGLRVTPMIRQLSVDVQ